MRIVNVFGFFSILCINFNQFNALSIELMKQKCNQLENSSTLLRLKRHLFCDYDRTFHPNYPKTTNITMNLMPKLINFEDYTAKLSLHSWLVLTWKDPHLTWTPSDYDDINVIHVKSWQIWMPNICINTSADMSSDQYHLPNTDCLLFHSGSVSCVPAVKFISKCNLDYTYWPYDKHSCHITFISWTHKGDEVNLLADESGINMNDYISDTQWNFKFIHSATEVRKYKCCPNETYPNVNYYFSLTRHHGKNQSTHIVPAIVLMTLTLTVLCLDLNSMERMIVASVNFVCHLLCLQFTHWILPYNGANPPNILLFYGESLALATFAIILTALLRKLEDISTEIPNWISFTTTFVLSNKAGRFLILNDDESKITGRDIVTEENSDISRSEIGMKKSSWKHFAAIIDWLSFFSVVLTYVIILIILIPRN